MLHRLLVRFDRWDAVVLDELADPLHPHCSTKPSGVPQVHRQLLQCGHPGRPGGSGPVRPRCRRAAHRGPIASGRNTFGVSDAKVGTGDGVGGGAEGAPGAFVRKVDREDRRERARLVNLPAERLLGDELAGHHAPDADRQPAFEVGEAQVLVECLRGRVAPPVQPRRSEDAQPVLAEGKVIAEPVDLRRRREQDAATVAGGGIAGEAAVVACWALTDVSFLEAVNMATSVPARIIHVDDRKGKLAVGMDADITMFDDDDSVFAAMRAGARGYLLKDADKDEVVRAIVAVERGEAIFSPAIAQRMMQYFSAPSASSKKNQPDEFAELTERELEILDLIAQGHNNLVISNKLSLSIKTVQNYVSSILTKLQVADRSQAIVRAREAGMGKHGQ